MSEDLSKSLQAISALRQTLDNELSVEVIHEGGYRWRAYFSFGEPALPEGLAVVERQLGTPLPLAYRRFLAQYDGALLYHDEAFGQWGFQLYGTASLYEANARWRQRYPEHWRSSLVAIAESYGDGDVIVLDTTQPVEDSRDCRVIDGESGYLPPQWEVAAPSFEDWLDRLVVAQGAKYWRWK